MEVLFWVGCAASFDPRLQSIARAFAEIMQKAEVDFAILGTEERCTGDIARRMGDEALFQQLASHNIQVLDHHQVRSIVTTCPHCFNMFKNEYPALGGNYEVMHYTTYIYKLIEDGRLKIPERQQREIVTYHDPCYLGRQNGVYAAPRDILEMLGYTIEEMERNKSQSFCCGAGGGTMFETVQRGDKINTIRAEEARSTGASMTMTACPFCLLMMEEAIGSLNQIKGGNMAAKDIAEVVNDITK
ncbi:CoB--CoM heterodisulfide reductase [Cohnella kolymensis]|uniref:CoB--CoM heterodisulfide reductase n=1 Tax=Cohnella kolymensis TaxID=1590652 RepID=A0ABR5A033_9BACL|nr:(Fe-S)-binding protein [Cohnella kolymensis]KIL34424.1 CoB--CoM heterodisulfide reductase [Cohnella kolymensis]